jgi:hypothetical protein
LQEDDTVQGWDLYIVEYPPADGEHLSGSNGVEMNWSWDWDGEDLESEQSSEVVGHQRRG